MTSTDKAGTHGAIIPDTAREGDDGVIVELRNAGKSYGNIRALHGVSLQVRPSQV
ncbi:sugar ABC transporter ATP-binding protein, partial [Streptomyces sp. NPDC057616]